MNETHSNSEVPRQWNTFINTPPENNDPKTAAVKLLPIPYDGTTSYRTGSRDGPSAIITASRQLEDYDLELDCNIADIGIAILPEIEVDVSGPESMISRIDKVVSSSISENSIIGLLGGEHTISIGAVQALKRHHKDLSVLYLDAHADLRETYMGSPWSHACVARRILETCPIVEIGVRSLSLEEKQLIEKLHIPVHFWPVDVEDFQNMIESTIDQLSEHIYISIDLDVLDPSIMSAVGNPEPGGITWEGITKILRSVSERKQVVGFDIVELSPEEGPEACSFIAAKLAYKLAGYATTYR